MSKYDEKAADHHPDRNDEAYVEWSNSLPNDEVEGVDTGDVMGDDFDPNHSNYCPTCGVHFAAHLDGCWADDERPCDLCGERLYGEIGEFAVPGEGTAIAHVDCGLSAGLEIA